MTPLVVAAFEPELERFRMLASEAALDIAVRGVGIGLVDAAAGATRAVLEAKPDFVLLLGTCGAMPGSGLAIGDVTVATTVQLVDAATLEGRAALPWTPAPLEGHAVHAFVAAGAIAAANATTLGITTDDALAATFARLAATEHLEAYAVARACQQLAVPCAIVLGVTNIVGASGRADWRANHVAVSARTAEVAVAGLRSVTGR